MTIHRAGPAHPVLLAEIHASAFPPADAWSIAMFAAQLGQPGVTALFDEAGGLIVMRNAADEAEILTLAVTPEARRRGIGRALLHAGCDAAAAAGATRIFLEAAASNHAALSLYEHYGFTRTATRRNYYSDGSDAIVMSRVCGQ